MKLITFDDGRVGRLQLEERLVLPLQAGSTREYFERDGKVAETGERLPLDDVTLRAPIVPKKFFHTSGNFREHEDESKNVDAIVGPEEPVIYPEHLTSELDYELEIAVVIGRPGKFFGVDDAPDHIAGYVVFNDISARDIQRREMESGVFSFCKAIDTFCPVGPYIVTADEIPDAQNLDMELRVNGVVRQKSNTNRMSVSIPHLVAYHSPQGYSAGDLITTGTVQGVAGFSGDPDMYLKPGDVVEAEVERLGVLRNPIVSWEQGHGTPVPQKVDW